MTKSKVEVKSSFLKAPSESKKDIPSKNIRRNHSFSKAPIVTTIFLIAIFFVIVIGIFVTGLLNVKNYRVSGNVQISADDIQAETKMLAQNKLIIDVDPVSIEKKLLDKFPLLSYARVSKELPSTLSIEVKERSKSAVIKTLENTVLVSEDGTVIEEVDESKIQNNMYQDITVVKMIDEPKKVKGDKFDINLITSISTLLNSWSKNSAPSYTDILIDKDKNVKIALTSGAIVIVSLADKDLDLDKLIADFNVLYNSISKGSKKIKTIDMRLDGKASVIYM